MIKQSLLNVGEDFFSQTFLLLFPVLIFSSSLEFALLVGTFSLAFIYFNSFLFLSLRKRLARNFCFPFVLGLSVFTGTLVSALSYYFFAKLYLENAYLFNLYFICILCWQKYPLRNRSLKIKDLNQQVLPSLAWLLLIVWFAALVRELLGTGCLCFFKCSFSIIPVDWTLPILETKIGALGCLFLSAYLLGLEPQNYNDYPLYPHLKTSSTGKKYLNKSIAEKTSQLEKLLNSSGDFIK